MSDETSVRNETQPRIQTPRSVRTFESVGIKYSAIYAILLILLAILSAPSSS